MNERNRANGLNRRNFLKLAGAAPLAFSPWPGRLRLRRQNSDSSLPNILIILFDSLSARHMSIYGYHRATTPNLEHLAATATVYHRHYAGGNFTTPGTASLLTGAYPWSHRGYNLYGALKRDFIDRSLFHMLPEHYSFAYTHNPLVNYLLDQFRKAIRDWTRTSELCLSSSSYADMFFRRDYRAAYDGELQAFRNANIPVSLILSRFDQMRRYWAWGLQNRLHAPRFPRGVPDFFEKVGPGYILFTLEQALDWVFEQVQEQVQPSLGYVHLFPPHVPYKTRVDFIDRFKDGLAPPDKDEHHFSEGKGDEFLVDQRRYYDEFISYVDAEFGRLYERLEQSGALENTILILTSDHGELFERGIFTHNTPVLYEPLVHIPLLIWSPGSQERRDIHDLTSCVDLLPTLLRRCGRPIPAWCDGQVLPGLDLEPDDRQILSNFIERSVYVVEGKDNPFYTPLTMGTFAVVRGKYKLVHYIGYEGYHDMYELYDLDADPEEMHNLYDEAPELAAELARDLHSQRNKHDSYE